MAVLIALANVPTWLANQKLPRSRSANQRTETQWQFTRVGISIVWRFLQLKVVKWTEMDSSSSFLSSLDEEDGRKSVCKKSKAADDVESSDIEPQIKYCGSKTSIKEGFKPYDDHDHNYNKEKASTNPPVSMLPPKPPTTVNKKRRCKECAPCLAIDCGQCVFCLDKPKFGGHNIKKAACLHRRCLNMVMVRLSPRKSSNSIPQKEDLVSQALDNIVIEEEPISGPSEGRKPQIKRTPFTAQQLDVLEEVFQKTSFPDKATSQEAALKISLPNKKVSCWFQKRRAKERDEAKRDKSSLDQFHYNDHNYHKLNVVETFMQTGETLADVQSEASERQEAVAETRSEHSNKKQDLLPEVSLHKTRGKSSVLVQEDVEQQGVVADLLEVIAGKRKLVQDKSFPARKKFYVNGCFSNLGDDEVLEVQDKVEDLKYIKPNPNINAETSLPHVNGNPVDFHCTICKKLPRSLNKSELYRHYATDHFRSKLMQKFGHLKVCPYCNLGLAQHSSSTFISHFGQKHSFVENFLPAEAWIADGELRKSSVTRVRKERKLAKKLNLVENKEDLPFGDLWVWPEIPEGFTPDGKVRGLEKGVKFCKQSCIIANVDGYDIELEKDECCEQEVSPVSSSAHEQVMKCKICEMKFDLKQQAVSDVQSVHIMKGSGDLFHDYDALLRTGYLAQETPKHTNQEVPAATPVEEELCPDTAVENSELSPDVDEPQSMELTKEERELIHAVERYQQSGCVAVETVDKAGDISEDGKVAEYTALEAGLKERCMNEPATVLSSELVVECVEFKSRVSDVLYPKVLESDEAEVSEKDGKKPVLWKV